MAGEIRYDVGYQVKGGIKMNVKISFDKADVERRGLALEDVRQTIKSLFAVHGLPCVSDGEVLIFQDKGHGDDFATMWDVILSLLRADWFRECAASCVWLDENGEEDVLAQAGKVPETGARAGSRSPSTSVKRRWSCTIPEANGPRVSTTTGKPTRTFGGSWRSRASLGSRTPCTSPRPP